MQDADIFCIQGEAFKWEYLNIIVTNDRMKKFQKKRLYYLEKHMQWHVKFF
jgi:hypothetical protein